jgi:hypothetical protein
VIGYLATGAGARFQPMRMARMALFAACTIGVAAGLIAPARAAYIIDITQSGSNVIAAGSGSIDTAALTETGHGSTTLGVSAVQAFISVGTTQCNFWDGFNGPTSFGTGTLVEANSGTGSFAGIEGRASFELLTPENYVSETVMSGTSIFDQETLAGMGLTQGTYVWTWGSGATADSFTVQIGPSTVPEPSSAALMLFPAFALIAGGHIRRKATSSP